MRLDYAEGPYFQRLANCRESDGVEEFLALAENHLSRTWAREPVDREFLRRCSENFSEDAGRC